eukprot:2166944-Pyramimonas_sp.AAC.1
MARPLGNRKVRNPLRRRQIDVWPQMEQIGGERKSSTSLLDKHVRRLQLVGVPRVEIDSQLRTDVGVTVAHAPPAFGYVDPGLIDIAMGGDLETRR